MRLTYSHAIAYEACGDKTQLGLNACRSVKKNVNRILAV